VSTTIERSHNRIGRRVASGDIGLHDVDHMVDMMLKTARLEGAGLLQGFSETSTAKAQKARDEQLI